VIKTVAAREGSKPNIKIADTSQKSVENSGKKPRQLGKGPLENLMIPKSGMDEKDTL
jgi:hypothetical protein